MATRTASASSTPAQAEYDGVWDSTDAKVRNEFLARVMDPQPPLAGDPWEDPMTGLLLCLPREQLQERIYNINQNQAILYGLIFSGVAGSALTPFAASEFDSGSTHRLLANAYNLIATMQLAICCASMWEATVMALAACCESDLTIFRFTVCSSKASWLLTLSTGYSALLLMVQMIIVNYIRSDSWWAHIICGALLLLILSRTAMFWPRIANASPIEFYPMINSPLIAPFMRLGLFGPVPRRLKQTANRLGALKAQEAASNFGSQVVRSAAESVSKSSGAAIHPADASEDALTDELVDLNSAQGQALMRFLAKALPSAPTDRTKTICVGLMKADLDLHTLAAAASMPLVLDNALKDDHMRLNLRAGERLAVVSAAAMISEPELARSPPLRAGQRGVSVLGGAFGARTAARDVNIRGHAVDAVTGKEVSQEVASQDGGLGCCVSERSWSGASMSCASWPAAAASPRQRLKRLEELLGDGLIGETEYARKRAAIVAAL